MCCPLRGYGYLLILPTLPHKTYIVLTSLTLLGDTESDSFLHKADDINLKGGILSTINFLGKINVQTQSSWVK